MNVASLPVLGQPLVREVVQHDVGHPDLGGGHADHVPPAVLTWRPRHVHVAPRERAHGADGQHLAEGGIYTYCTLKTVVFVRAYPDTAGRVLHHIISK